MLIAMLGLLRAHPAFPYVNRNQLIPRSMDMDRNNATTVSCKKSISIVCVACRSYMNERDIVYSYKEKGGIWDNL